MKGRYLIKVFKYSDYLVYEGDISDIIKFGIKNSKGFRRKRSVYGDVLVGAGLKEVYRDDKMVVFDLEIGL